MLFFSWGILFGLLVFLFYNVHYLMLLLSIELILLGLVVLLCGYGSVSFFFFLLLVVCAGAFSVSLLVSVFRGYGRDFWCCCY